MKNLVIAFAGAKGSGKTAISQAFADMVQAPRVGFGDYVRAEAVRRGLPTTVESLQALGETLISDGWEKFCGNVLAQTNWHSNKALVIDGIRHIQAVTTLRRLISPTTLFLVFVDTNFNVRLERLKTRDHVDHEHIKQIESHSTETDTKQALPTLADVVIDGTRPLDELLRFLRSRIT